MTDRAREALRSLLVLWDAYQESDLNHANAHDCLVRYEVWDEARAALLDTSRAVDEPTEVMERADAQLAFADDAIDGLISTLAMYVHTLDIPAVKAGNFARGEIAVLRKRLAAIAAMRAAQGERE